MTRSIAFCCIAFLLVFVAVSRNTTAQAVASDTGDQEMSRCISWSDVAKENNSEFLVHGEIQAGGADGSPEQLRVENTAGQPLTIKLLDLKKPGISKFRYAITGDIRYDNVQEKSYLEMWSYFADGQRYFSRTVSESGPMQFIDGNSDWRAFSLPFESSAKTGVPVRVLVNLVLSGNGTVYMGPLQIRQYRNRWWSERTGAWIGGIGGSVIGVCGALIGILAGTGRARRFVLTLTTTLTVAGGIFLGTGVVALALRQPYGVYYPLLLGGIILTAVCGGNLPVLYRRYAEIELRKMSAMDAG